MSYDNVKKYTTIDATKTPSYLAIDFKGLGIET